MKRLLILLTVPTLFLAAQAISGQAITTRVLTVAVFDRDLEIPLEGVKIQEASTGESAVTDFSGSATIEVTLPTPRAVLHLSLIGYEPVRTMVTDFTRPVEIPMVIEGILEAEELVVEVEQIGRTDDETGVSVVVERDFIKSSSMIGIIEDVLSTVKILPGVSYAGGFNSFLSVRGGDPMGLTHVLDGFVVSNPYHWGGGVSIFNPHIIETVKLSAGIFPVIYGQATSGLMEVSTVNPTQGLRWEFAQSTSTLEGYAQIPFGETTGFSIGTRLTNYDLVFALTGQFLEEQGVTFSRVPFIYDTYAKWYTRPTPKTEWFANGFLGTDGIGIEAIQPDIDLTQEIRNTFDFRWINLSAFADVGVKQLVGDRLLLRSVGGYEYVNNEIEGTFAEEGTRFYSDAFVAAYDTDPLLGSLVDPGGSFSIDQPNGIYNDNIYHHFQLRADADYQLRDNSLLQFGTGTFVIANEYSADVSFWTTVEDPPGSGNLETKLQTFDSSAPANRSLASFAYTNLQWFPRADRFRLDTGIRVDHAILFGDDFSLNTYPVPGPRALLHYTPDPFGSIEEMTISLGTGVFSKAPFDATLLTGEMGVKDFEVSVPKNFMTVLGWEARFPRGYRFKIESYYKYLYDRFYLNAVETETSTTTQSIEQVLHTDGIGHVAGFDLLLDRRTSRYFDGMLSYSFIYARYKNPTGDGYEGSASEPRERWYYPAFHRFHTFNLLLNIKPRDWFTLTTTLTFASGTLEPGYGVKEMSPVVYVDAGGNLTVAETYTRDEYYDDDNRMGFELPLDIRAAFHRYRQESKMYREFYLGAEDVLSPLLSRIAPTSSAVRTDKYTGEDTSAADQGVSFPIISVGFRISY